MLARFLGQRFVEVIDKRLTSFGKLKFTPCDVLLLGFRLNLLDILVDFRKLFLKLFNRVICLGNLKLFICLQTCEFVTPFFKTLDVFDLRRP